MHEHFPQVVSQRTVHVLSRPPQKRVGCLVGLRARNLQIELIGLRSEELHVARHNFELANDLRWSWRLDKHDTLRGRRELLSNNADGRPFFHGVSKRKNLLAV